MAEADDKTAGEPSPPRPTRKPPARRKRLLLKQPVMHKVLYALGPILLAGIYFFGWRVLCLVAVCAAAGMVTEWITARRRHQPMSTALFVTVGLYALSLPPSMPWWKAVVGIVVAVLFGKEVFGGFGRNPFNPAIVGRAFVYTCFPAEMTQQFYPVLSGLPGGFGAWSGYDAAVAAAGGKVVDAVSQATPLYVYKTTGAGADVWQLFLGNIGGPGAGGAKLMGAGSIGEVSAALIVLCGVYLIVTKTANWRLTVSTIAGAAAFTALAHGLSAGGGEPFIPPVHYALCGGGLMYAAVFMTTDPVSAPKQKSAMVAYGLLIGVLIMWLRWRSNWAGAVAFAILLGNIAAPLLDRAAKALAARKAPKPAAPKPAANAAGNDPGGDV